MTELKTVYKKRSKTKESNGISSLLQRHTIRGQINSGTLQAKKKLLGDAYFFAVVNKAIDEIFQSEFPNLVEDLKLCEIFVRHEQTEIKITIQSGDICFLAWFKTECGHIREKLMGVLVEKKLLKSESEILLVGKRK